MSREDFLTMRLAERSVELERLRAALEEIARKQKMDAVAAVSMRAIARAALKNGERSVDDYPDPQDRWEGWPEPPPCS